MFRLLGNISEEALAQTFYHILFTKKRKTQQHERLQKQLSEVLKSPTSNVVPSGCGRSRGRLRSACSAIRKIYVCTGTKDSRSKTLWPVGHQLIDYVNVQQECCKSLLPVYSSDLFNAECNTLHRPPHQSDFFSACCWNESLGGDCGKRTHWCELIKITWNAIIKKLRC